MAKKPPKPPYKDKKKYKPFDATTQGLGRNEMIRRTQQHNILASKKYEESKRYDVYGINEAWVTRNVSGNEMNPWVMKEIANQVSHIGTRDRLRQDALKMWDTVSSFEVGTPVVKRTKKYNPNLIQDLQNKGYGSKGAKGFLDKQLDKTIQKIENPIGYVYNTIKDMYSKYKKLDLSTNKPGKYGVDY